ncbi:MAG: RNHCP domain-containing protein [Clostridiales bacterium]|jgi:hypothetical protein|nr:RNHCP domain-containing protein [Clostridiales bacterium]
MSDFKKNDTSFECTVCKRQVSALGYSSRNHCNACLCSVHADVNPGDRANDCGGIMRPVSAILNNKGYVIIFKCEKCGAVKRNKAAADDDLDMLIKLTAQPFKTL